MHLSWRQRLPVYRRRSHVAKRHLATAGLHTGETTERPDRIVHKRRQSNRKRHRLLSRTCHLANHKYSGSKDLCYSDWNTAFIRETADRHGTCRRTAMPVRRQHNGHPNQQKRNRGHLRGRCAIPCKKHSDGAHDAGGTRTKSARLGLVVG